MRNNTINRADIGSGSPFDLLKTDQSDLLDLDNMGGEIPKPIEPTPKPVERTPVPLKEGEESDEVENEQDEEEAPSNAKVKIKTNVPKLLAERLKIDGQLPEDFEVTDKTTSKDVESAYRKFMSDNVRQEERNAALEELKSEYDDRVLKSAQKLHYGVTEQEIRMEEAYSMLGSVEFDDSQDTYEQSIKMLFQQYYLDKGLTNDEAESNASRDFEDSDDITTLTQKRQNYFANRAAEIEESHKEKINNSKLAEKTKREESLSKTHSYLDKAETEGIDGVKYSKQDIEFVRKSLFEKSEVIVNEQGQRIRVTPYYKKKYDRARNEEQSVKDIIDFVLGYDVKKVSDKAGRSARKKLVDDLNDLIEVDVELTSSKGPYSNQRTDNGGVDIVRKSL